jgi:hypothetical protein
VAVIFPGYFSEIMQEESQRSLFSRFFMWCLLYLNNRFSCAACHYVVSRPIVKIDKVIPL